VERYTATAIQSHGKILQYWWDGPVKKKRPLHESLTALFSGRPTVISTISTGALISSTTTSQVGADHLETVRRRLEISGDWRWLDQR
jgi:hypothetical protein